MVDSIRRNNSSPSSQGSSKQSPESLRANFKNLSSGVNVQGTANAQGTGSPPEKEKRQSDNAQSDKVSGILHSLNDAVSFSALALKSLENIGEAAKNPKNTPSPDIGKPQNIGVRDFAQDLETVKDHISSVINLLRSRADTAEVIQENYTSSGVKLRDVSLAQTEATKTRSQIQNNITQAIDAHGGLIADRVVRLIAE